jgi:hypothetical protein
LLYFFLYRLGTFWLGRLQRCVAIRQFVDVRLAVWTLAIWWPRRLGLGWQWA